VIKSKELEDFKIKYQNIETELLLMKRPFIEEITQKPLILSDFYEENHKKDEEMLEIKRLEELLFERNEELERFFKENKLLHQENEDLRKENEDLRRDLMNPRMEFHEISQNERFMEITDENKKIKMLLGDKIAEIDQYKEKIGEYQEKIDEFNEKLEGKSKEISLKENEIEKLKKGIFEIGNLYKKDIGAFEKKIKEKGGKSEENAIKELKRELEEKEKVITGYKERNQALKNESIGKECENSKLREKLMNLEHENFLTQLKRRDSIEEKGFSEVFSLFSFDLIGFFNILCNF